MPPRPAPAPEAGQGDSALASIQKFIDDTKIPTSGAKWRNKVPKPPMATFTEGKKYFWNLSTNKGAIKIQLMPDVAPMHVTSTIYLTKLGYYDGLIFHRVIKGFMAQGGCPDGTGGGSPGYQYGSEVSPAVRHDRPGLLSMANTNKPNTDGSQFFLTFAPAQHLNNKHTIFGEVIDGMDAVRKLEAVGSRSGQTSERLTMDRATISVE